MHNNLRNLVLYEQLKIHDYYVAVGMKESSSRSASRSNMSSFIFTSDSFRSNCHKTKEKADQKLNNKAVPQYSQ